MEASASLQRAQADARLAASTYERFNAALSANAVSVQERDEARETRDITAAAVAVAQAQLDTIIVDIEKASLRAPFNGVVVRRLRDEGAIVTAGQVIMEIQQDDALDIRVGLAGPIAERLVVGDTRQVKIAGELYEAKVSSIIPVRGQTRTVDALLSLTNNGQLVRPGDVVRMPIANDVTKRGFWVPLDALVEGQRGLWTIYASVVQDGSMKAERRTVEVHYVSSTRAYVSGAVSDKETIIIEGAAKIVPGQEIRIAEVTDGKS